MKRYCPSLCIQRESRLSKPLSSWVTLVEYCHPKGFCCECKSEISFLVVSSIRLFHFSAFQLRSFLISRALCLIWNFWWLLGLVTRITLRYTETYITVVVLYCIVFFSFFFCFSSHAIRQAIRLYRMQMRILSILYRKLVRETTTMLNSSHNERQRLRTVINNALENIIIIS